MYRLIFVDLDAHNELDADRVPAALENENSSFLVAASDPTHNVAAVCRTASHVFGGDAVLEAALDGNVGSCLVVDGSGATIEVLTDEGKQYLFGNAADAMEMIRGWFNNEIDPIV